MVLKGIAKTSNNFICLSPNAKEREVPKWVIQADLARKFHQYLGLKKVGVYEIMVGLSKGQA